MSDDARETLLERRATRGRQFLMIAARGKPTLKTRQCTMLAAYALPPWTN